MARKVTFSSDALDALAGARAWLLQSGSGRVGRQRWEALLAAPERLVDSPYSGPPDTEHEGYRHLSVSGYRIIYLVDPDTGDRETAGDISIAAIFGPGQNRPLP